MSRHQKLLSISGPLILFLPISFYIICKPGGWQVRSGGCSGSSQSPAGKQRLRRSGNQGAQENQQKTKTGGNTVHFFMS